ncbi:pentatricopeptide repeat-containing protein At2g17033-like, partial [Tasmannia lanceolata]|uniref:pentatricopeptide repeat-containing protein At2g17033-like n=1 Tax=Tasmannia lanceolata TaxID=3420 RepID=UPI004062F0AF
LEHRSIALNYGRSGLFEEMRRVVRRMEDSGIGLDTVIMNIVLSCYGEYGEMPEMVSWVRKMRDLDIAFSVRTYNSVLNSCPTMISIVGEPDKFPLSIVGLVEKLEKASSSPNEVLLIKELVSSVVLEETLQWSSSEGKLDLHGMHTCSSYLILLQWLEELRLRFSEGTVLPLEISVVCGSGKYSSIRGESPVKALVSEMMFRMSSPLKIDRKNTGRFVARGKAVKDWLC